MITERELQRLRSEIANLRARVPLRPQLGGGGETIAYCEVVGGNTIMSPANLDGIAATAPTITEVPTLEPTPGDPYDDGLGVGYLTADMATPVWLVNGTVTVQGGADVSGAVGLDVPAAAIVLVTGPYQVAIAGTSPVEYAPVYVTWKV